MSTIHIENLSFTHSGDHTPVFQDLNLHLDTSWKLGLFGRNGRGKTTLLRLIEGSLKGDGIIFLQEPGRYFPKKVKNPDQTVGAILTEDAPDAEQWQLKRELSLLGFGDEVLERSFSTLSGGEQTRVLLAGSFLNQGSWTLLDEPTNHLDSQGREHVARYLREHSSGFLLVSHDRAFLDDCVDHVLALNPSGPELLRGNFSTWMTEKQARDRRELAMNEKLKREIKRLEKTAAQTANWSDRTEQGKYVTPSTDLRPDRGYVGHKAAKLMKRSKQLQRRQEKAIEEKADLLKDVERADPLKLNPAHHYSRQLLEGRDISIVYNAKQICRPLELSIDRGERICLSGGNGSGKSSLLRLFAGEQINFNGKLWRAAGLKISYVPQDTENLCGTLLEFANVQQINFTQFLTVLRKLDFSRAQLERKIQEYSAGQKKKVALAASLCSSAHLYIWDEPLNYIDIFSRMQIEQLLLESKLTLVFSEHDRVFRDTVATKMIEL